MSTEASPSPAPRNGPQDPEASPGPPPPHPQERPHQLLQDPRPAPIGIDMSFERRHTNSTRTLTTLRLTRPKDRRHRGLNLTMIAPGRQQRLPLGVAARQRGGEAKRLIVFFHSGIESTLGREELKDVHSVVVYESTHPVDHIHAHTVETHHNAHAHLSSEGATYATLESAPAITTLASIPYTTDPYPYYYKADMYVKDETRRGGGYDYVQPSYMTSASHAHPTAHSHAHLQKAESAMWTTTPEYSQLPPEMLERPTAISHHSYMTQPAPASWSSAGYDSILHTANGETYRRIEPGEPECNENRECVNCGS
ncbi:uncharacterized protein LOC125039854 [Penaeus chinensis]|uniref:uncharacterized protein LOC125039854 n=1 Tax=Penaeus chinensis TaxID=139456 RepID=UPI001FB80BC5|nr:uncharacterized protein LOC125039854 [Penaeus chinensis]